MAKKKAGAVKQTSRVPAAPVWENAGKVLCLRRLYTGASGESVSVGSEARHPSSSVRDD